MPINITALY